jgi:hypothetical protein
LFSFPLSGMVREAADAVVHPGERNLPPASSLLLGVSIGDEMRRILAAGAFAAAIAASSSAGMASLMGRTQDFAVSVASTQILQQRKDVDEVSRPQPPSGPATPVPFCSPGQPICP